MIGTKLTQLGRLAELEISISIPCRHWWRSTHCDRDDEGSHVSEGGDGIMRHSDGSSLLLSTDGCYCGEATTFIGRPFGWVIPYLERRATLRRNHTRSIPRDSLRL